VSWESRLHVAAKVAEWLEDQQIMFVVNMSGGKDSTAVDLLLTEAGIQHRRVFADTGWEAAETYAHLALLREKLGPIDVVGRAGGMLQLAREKAGFPQRRGRWCTEKLKIEPLRAHFDQIAAQGFEPVSVVIDAVVAWSRTDRGGRHLSLFPPPPDGGCFRWGLCEAPGEGDK
jgi:3'-phosphoadenosine 5'-phosphosulfate sulfotransferase (PAPS reductase)/FAD synthetase